MIDSPEAIANSLQALSEQFHAIAQNLANVNTSGYKRILCDFINAPAGAAAPANPDAITVKTVHDFSPGTLVQTERALDLGLQGKGFFVLETPDGQLYTRHGVFTTSADGRLVDLSGRAVAGESGPIVIPRNAPLPSINVSADGNISAGKTVLGKLKLVEFADPQVLVAAGQNAFQGPADQATAAKTTTVHQGFQEASNVGAVDELVQLIMVSRLYEANTKAAHAYDERMKTLLGVAAG
jgi:flagellar basal-body rod protein FlgF